MRRKRVVVGKIKECGDHFHLEYECIGCRGSSLGPMNATKFELCVPIPARGSSLWDFDRMSRPKAVPNICG
jgi:hypothetical protein